MSDSKHAWKRLCVWSASAALLVACGAADEANPIVGSGTMQQLTVDATQVQRITISVPFKAAVYNGEPRQLLVRGEDNLIPYIDVEEVSAGEWKVVAPLELRFEQHEELEIEVPYVEMVKIGFDERLVRLADDPVAAWGG